MRFSKPLWLYLPPNLAHSLAPLGLQLMAAFRDSKVERWLPFEWRGLEFHNRLGIAGGVDKDGDRIEDWWTFGPGFIEVGTVTPEPQGPNDGRIFDRDLRRRALWNRMGFPGSGAWRVRENLRDLPAQRLTPIFVNIGKNRSTPNELAARDYAECMRIIGDLADAYVVNISSPNTTGLRELFKPENFRPFLKTVIDARDAYMRRKAPLLLKLSPDLSDADLIAVVEQSNALGVDGWIATNTTLTREPGMVFPSEGGVSGQPLKETSRRALLRIMDILGARRGDKLIVSVGGVMTSGDVKERLDLGADLVQVYSTLVFEGPGFFTRVAQFMSKGEAEQK